MISHNPNKIMLDFTKSRVILFGLCGHVEMTSNNATFHNDYVSHQCGTVSYLTSDIAVQCLLFITLTAHSEDDLWIEVEILVTSIMITKLLVNLFIIKLYARINTFNVHRPYCK